MASLDLMPNTGLILAHAGVFIASSYVFSKLAIVPYLKLREERESQTLGQSTNIDEIKVEVHKKQTSIEEDIKEAHLFARKVYDESKEKANAEQAELINLAKSNAKSQLEEARKKIDMSLSSERNKSKETVEKLVKQVLDAVVN